MKTLVIVATLFFAFAGQATQQGIMAPRGEYTDITCQSVHRMPPVNVDVVKNAKTGSVKLVISGVRGSQDYPAAGGLSKRVGGPYVYTAQTANGRILLSYYPNSRGMDGKKRGTLTVVQDGMALPATELQCSQINY